MNPSNVLLLPGWQNSGPAHWQSRWEATHGYVRVQQHDWLRPLRGDWSIQLEEAVLASDAPVTLVAHSLGCILVAAWAAHSRNTQHVKAALLVAPPDVERDDIRALLPSWSPIIRFVLPFKSLVLTSENDSHSTLGWSQQLARDWGAKLVSLGPVGHINAESGLGDWAQGHAMLLDLRGSQNDYLTLARQELPCRPSKNPPLKNAFPPASSCPPA